MSTKSNIKKRCFRHLKASDFQCHLGQNIHQNSLCVRTMTKVDLDHIKLFLEDFGAFWGVLGVFLVVFLFKNIVFHFWNQHKTLLVVRTL